MTTAQLKQSTEYTQQYTTELKNIDNMINTGVISYTEYKMLIIDAYNDYTARISNGCITCGVSGVRLKVSGNCVGCWQKAV